MPTKSILYGGAISISLNSSDLPVSQDNLVFPSNGSHHCPENQIAPFNFSTPDGELLYAWHILPLGLYAKHESEILQEQSGCIEDITVTKAFRLLKDDPDSLLIINCE